MTSADRDFPLKTSLTEIVNIESADQLTGPSDSRRVLERLFESGVSPSIPTASALSIAQQIENGQDLIYLLEREHLH